MVSRCASELGVEMNKNIDPSSAGVNSAGEWAAVEEDSLGLLVKYTDADALWIARPVSPASVKAGDMVSPSTPSGVVCRIDLQGGSAEVWVRCGMVMLNRNAAECARNFDFFRSIATQDVKTLRAELRAAGLLAADAQVDAESPGERTGYDRPAGG